MEWVRETGPDAGKTMFAIYEWIDDDHYRVCVAQAGKERPKEFATLSAKLNRICPTS